METKESRAAMHDDPLSYLSDSVIIIKFSGCSCCCKGKEGNECWKLHGNDDDDDEDKTKRKFYELCFEILFRQRRRRAKSFILTALLASVAVSLSTKVFLGTFS